MILEDYQLILDTKLDILEKLNQTYPDTDTKETKETMLQILDRTTDNLDLNNETSLLMVEDILDNLLNLDDPDTVLTEEEAKLAAKITDQLLLFLGENCENQDSELFNEMKAKSYDYLDTITRSLTVDKVYADNATLITEDSFDIYSKRASACEL